MSVSEALSQPPGERVISPTVAALVMHLINELTGAFAELADAVAEATAVREQRNMVLVEAHRLHRRVKQLDARHLVTCERSREQQREIVLLRAKISELEGKLAQSIREAA
jgi:hypothetical protein